jgi:ankyrin repeat protein
MAPEASVIAAVQSGDVAAVRQMLQADKSAASAKDANGVSAVMHAYYRGRREIADALIAAKPELDIFEATAAGNAERVSQILKRDPGAAKGFSADGFTALHFAAFFNRPAIARDLVRHGADVAAVAQNPMKVMPLHSAAAAHSREIVGLLLASGAPPNARQHGGWTALHEAAQIGDIEMMRDLLSHGADSSARNDDGKTSADMAEAKGHKEVLKMLK